MTGKVEDTFQMVDKNPDESKDCSFNSILVDMLEKTKDNTMNLLDPVSQKPIHLLKKLIQTASIQNPENTFKFSITEESRNAINEQIRMHQLNIISAVKRDEYIFIRYKLDELKFLKENLKADFISQIYQDCLNQVQSLVNEKYKKTIDSLNGCLAKHNRISKGDIEAYKDQVDNFYGLTKAPHYARVT